MVELLMESGGEIENDETECYLLSLYKIMHLMIGDKWFNFDSYYLLWENVIKWKILGDRLYFLPPWNSYNIKWQHDE